MKYVVTKVVGVAGVHAVVSELSLRGLISLPAICNTDRVDVLVSKKRSKIAVSWK